MHVPIYLRGMRISKWAAIVSALILIASCFFPWVIIETKNITVSGVEAAGTGFGKPGYMHFFLSAIYLIFLLINKWWGARIALFVGAFNFAWAIRNFIIISTCYGGECPVKQPAIYFMLLGAIGMLIAIFFTPTPVSHKKND